MATIQAQIRRIMFDKAVKRGLSNPTITPRNLPLHTKPGRRGMIKVSLIDRTGKPVRGTTESFRMS